MRFEGAELEVQRQATARLGEQGVFLFFTCYLFIYLFIIILLILLIFEGGGELGEGRMFKPAFL